MFDFENFSNSVTTLGATPARDSFRLLSEYYAEDTRHYHDTSHVIECLSQFQKYRHLAEAPAEIEVAFWFHDAIYDTKQNDNEELSAELAEAHLVAMKAKSQSISNVVDMILATKTHQVTSDDSKLMLDIDLGILGTPPEVFEDYDRKIRLEFEWVPLELYSNGRKQVLQTFLERGKIFQTDLIRSTYEAQARENLARKIAELEA